MIPSDANISDIKQITSEINVSHARFGINLYYYLLYVRNSNLILPCIFICEIWRSYFGHSTVEKEKLGNEVLRHCGFSCVLQFEPLVLLKKLWSSHQAFLPGCGGEDTCHFVIRMNSSR